MISTYVVIVEITWMHQSGTILLHRIFSIANNVLLEIRSYLDQRGSENRNKRPIAAPRLVAGRSTVVAIIRLLLLDACYRFEVADV